MEIVIEVGHRLAVIGLDQELGDQIRAQFEYENPKRKELERLGYPVWKEPRTIRTWGDGSPAEHSAILSLPRGGMGRLRAALCGAGLPYRTIDRRVEGDAHNARVPDHLVELREYQQESVEKLIAKEQGILRAGTGSGKTEIALATIAALGLPAIAIVCDGGLFDQWVERASSSMGLHTSELGMIRGKKRRLGPVTIAMQKTLFDQGIDEELQHYFGTVVFDEAQRAGARTIFGAVDPFPARYRFAFSADEKRKDRKEFLVYDLFGDVVAEVKQEDLVRSGHVLDVECRVLLTDFRADWWRAEDHDIDRLYNEMGADKARWQLGLDVALEELEAGEQVLLFAHRREQVHALEREFAAHGIAMGKFLGGDENRKEYLEAKEGFRSGSLRVAAGTFQAVGTGIDLPSVAVGICMTPVSSNRQLFGQVRGRICRPSRSTGKTTARVYCLYDRHVFGLAQLENLARWNKHCVVLGDGAWIEARHYLKDLRKRSAEARRF